MNPDDEGEGMNAKPMEEMIGIANTITHKLLKVKPDPEEFQFKKYLCRFNQRQSGIKHDILDVIEKYGTIQNVKPDGNCGFYSVMNGLSHVGIKFQENINFMRKDIYNYINENREKEIKR